tara:strand:+ start:3242 stop:4012 length:771 start_codon:yes stop_codon:yes gene_type:complete
MKTNIKALKLVEKGLSSNTVSKLTESQINVLYSKLLGEASVTVSSKNPNAADIAKNMVAQDVNVTMTEKEIDEDDQFVQDVQNQGYGDTDQDEKQQGPGDYGNNPENDKKMNNNDVDGMGMMEEKDKPNPWSICHSQVGPKKSRKWERCVREVKKQLAEGKNPVSLFLESQIQKIVEKHMPPKITKGDLMKYISENSPEPITKPAPPTTKPGTRPRPSHPGKNPNPGENPAPKAKKVSPEDAKDKVIDVIMQLLEK